MVLVLVSARYKRILEWLENTGIPISIIKRIGPKVFLYINSDLKEDEVISLFHHHIRNNGGSFYVYQFYKIYLGMIDYNDYLSNATKQSMPYYQTENKDINEKEIEEHKKVKSCNS